MLSQNLSEMQLSVSFIKFYFVTKSGTTDDASKDLVHSYEEIAKVALSTEHLKWISHADCIALPPSSLTKQNIFVLDMFEGEVFERLRLTEAAVLGPRCVLTCHLTNNLVPNIVTPIFTFAMKNVVICVTGISFEKRGEIHKLVGFMGGSYSTDLAKSCTHLITNTNKSPKYKEAARRNMKIMKEDWIFEVWKLSKTADTSYTTEEFYHQFKLPIFYNLVITSTGISDAEKTEIIKLITNNGGVYGGSFNSKTTDILISQSNQANTEKFKAAARYRKECLTIDWVHDSVSKGYALPYVDYRIYTGQLTNTQFSNVLVRSDGFNSDGPRFVKRWHVASDTVPEITTPIFTYTLKNAVAYVAVVDSQKRSIIHSLIGFMGGVWTNDLSESTTLLITNSINSPDYEYAAKRNMQIMKEESIIEKWNKIYSDLSKSDDIDGTVPFYQPNNLSRNEENPFHDSERNKTNSGEQIVSSNHNSLGDCVKDLASSGEPLSPINQNSKDDCGRNEINSGEQITTTNQNSTADCGKDEKSSSEKSTLTAQILKKNCGKEEKSSNEQVTASSQNSQDNCGKNEISSSEQISVSSQNSKGSVAQVDITGCCERNDFPCESRSALDGNRFFSLYFITDVEQQTFTEKILALKGNVCEGEVADSSTFDPSCTHLICAKPNRSEKVFSAIASGRWFLCPAYIVDSFNAGHFLNEEDYEWGNPKAKSKLPSDLNSKSDEIATVNHKWREELQLRSKKENKRVGIFSGFRAILHSHRKDSFKRLLEAGGGVVIDIKEPYSEQKDVQNVTHCFIDKNFHQMSNTDQIALRKAGIHCEKMLYLQNCILDIL